MDSRCQTRTRRPMKHEPSIATLRNHNRRIVNAWFDRTIPPQLHAMRHDLMIQNCDARSRADQVAALHQVLKRQREQQLAVADEIAERGYRIKEINTEGNRLVLKNERVRNTTFSGASEYVGGESSAAKN